MICAFISSAMYIPHVLPKVATVITPSSLKMAMWLCLAFRREASRSTRQAGRLVINVNPAGTSQHCSECLNRVPKSLSDRWHTCPHCGLSIQRDHNSGVLIKKVGLGIASLKNPKHPQRCGEALAVTRKRSA